jgi:hypothetical protein
MTEAVSSAGRSCGSCTLCCKVFAVPPVENKPRGVWCKHCKPGQGCGIWQTRPEFCREFHCLWIKDVNLGPQWQPNVAKFVMNWWSETTLHITCDPASPMAYRQEPYWTSLRDTARKIAPNGRILIFKGNHKYVLLPDGERLLGDRDAQVDFRIAMETRASGTSYFIDVMENGAIRRVA